MRGKSLGREVNRPEEGNEKGKMIYGKEEWEKVIWWAGDMVVIEVRVTCG